MNASDDQRTRTAIIYVRDPIAPLVRGVVMPMLQLARGVNDVDFEPKESRLTLVFESETTTLAELVRVIEDFGTTVTSVTQRRSFGHVTGSF